MVQNTSESFHIHCLECIIVMEAFRYWPIILISRHFLQPQVDCNESIQFFKSEQKMSYPIVLNINLSERQYFSSVKWKIKLKTKTINNDLWNQFSFECPESSLNFGTSILTFPFLTDFTTGQEHMHQCLPHQNLMKCCKNLHYL